MPDNFIELADIVYFAFEVLGDFANWNELTLAFPNVLSNPLSKVSLLQLSNHVLINAPSQLLDAVLRDFNCPFPILNIDSCGTTVHGKDRCKANSKIRSS